MNIDEMIEYAAYGRKKPMTDEVNQPGHYNQGSIEAIQAVEASMSEIEFLGYLKGNVIKYLWRYRNKGKASTDLAKATWYLNRLSATVAASDMDRDWQKGFS
jgi:hypothetical protein